MLAYVPNCTVWGQLSFSVFSLAAVSGHSATLLKQNIFLAEPSLTFVCWRRSPPSTSIQSLGQHRHPSSPSFPIVGPCISLLSFLFSISKIFSFYPMDTPVLPFTSLSQSSSHWPILLHLSIFDSLLFYISMYYSGSQTVGCNLIFGGLLTRLPRSLKAF